MLLAYRKPAVLLAGSCTQQTRAEVIVYTVYSMAPVFREKMPALDISMIETLGRELHPPHTGLMSEAEVRSTASHYMLG
jgi:hypothetical protein